MKFNVEDINDYRDKLTKKQEKQLLKHCNNHQIAPNICAWYNDFNDLVTDYDYHSGYSRNETKIMYNNQEDMFCKFDNGKIVKLIK